MTTSTYEIRFEDPSTDYDTMVYTFDGNADEVVLKAMASGLRKAGASADDPYLLPYFRNVEVIRIDTTETRIDF